MRGRVTLLIVCCMLAMSGCNKKPAGPVAMAVPAPAFNSQIKERKLPKGREPGTFHFTYFGQLEFTREPPEYMEIVSRGHSEGVENYKTRSLDDQSYVIEVNLPPGSYRFNSQEPVPEEEAAYDSIILLSVDIDENGIAVIDPNASRHELKLQLVEPALGSSKHYHPHPTKLNTPRPELKWKPVEGVRYYDVTIYQEHGDGGFRRQYSESVPNKIKAESGLVEYQLNKKLGLNQQYQLLISASDTKEGRHVADLMTGPFEIIEGEIPPEPETARLNAIINPINFEQTERILKPGDAPGTYIFSHSGRVQYAREPVAESVISIINVNTVSEKYFETVTDKDHAVSIETELPSGTYVILSEPPTKEKKPEYNVAFSGQFEIDESGKLTLDNEPVFHELSIQFNYPSENQTIEPKNPVLKWQAVEGAKYYRVFWVELKEDSPKKIKLNKPEIEVTSTEYRIEENLLPGRKYFWTIRAMDASYNQIGFNTCTFSTSENLE